MSLTNTQIVTQALKRLAIVQAGEAPSAVDVVDGAAALTQMVSSWSASGVDVTLPVASKFEAAVVANLALRLAGDYNVNAGPKLVEDATTGWQQLQAAYIEPATPSFDWALIRTPSRRLPYTVPIDGNSPWKALTSYGLAEFVTNAGNVYVCIVAGTSSTTGPAGTSLNQTDGTCKWDYVQAIGGV